MRRIFQTGVLAAAALGVLVGPGSTARGQSAEAVELQRRINEAHKLHQEGKSAEAAEGYGRAAALSRRVPSAGAQLTCGLLVLQGMSYLEAEQAAKARPVLERALAECETVLGKNHPRTAGAAYGLARANADLRDFDTAESLFLRSRRLFEAAGPGYTAQLVEVLVHLAELYRTTKRPAQAEPLFLRGIELMEALGDRNHPLNLAAALGNLGKIYRENGEYTRAEETLRRARTIVEAHASGNPRLLSGVLHDLALVYLELGQQDRAEALSSRGLNLLEEALGKDHLELQYHLQLLGAIARRKGEDNKALACYERWRKLLETHLGPKDPSLYYVLGSEAALHGKHGRYDQALALELRGLKLLEESVGPDDPEVALALVNLSVSYYHLGELARTEEMLERGLRIRERRLGSGHHEVGHTLDFLAAVYGDAGKWDRAIPAFDRARRLHRAFVGRILPGLSEAQQAAFLDNLDGATFGSFSALSVALARKDDAATVARTAEWLLNEKAVVQQALAERGLLARDGSDPALAPVVRELNATRRRLAALALAAPKAGSEEEHRKQLRLLEEREQELAERVGRAGGHRTANDPWVGLEDVRKALPADGVLVEIASFPVRAYDYASRNKAESSSRVRFVAWVIPPAGRGEVRVLDLGEAEAIDKAVQAARTALQGAAAAVSDKGEPEAEKELRKPLEEVARRILHPLLEHIGASKQWVLSPDAALWLVPWAALPLPNGKYAVEEHTIRHVVSGRDLAAPAAKGTPGRPRIVADPDYDLTPAEAVAQAKELVGERSPGELRGLLPGARLPRRVPRLPGTAVEAAAIKTNLEKYAGQAPWVYLREQAVEGVVKSFSSPAVLVLSTHGYFLPGEGKKPENSPAAGNVLENPLLRCGLLLAGCNQRDRATGPREEDGVLTGLEILEMDLRGTELVVLSACETGLGDVRGGEGVAGLRQAFQLAGARAVVATLWQIPDRETARLMNDFFAHLAEGQDKAEALRRAQLKLIESRRQRDGAAHPLFWAAFTLTGQGK